MTLQRQSARSKVLAAIRKAPKKTGEKILDALVYLAGRAMFDMVKAQVDNFVYLDTPRKPIANPMDLAYDATARALPDLAKDGWPTCVSRGWVIPVTTPGDLKRNAEYYAFTVAMEACNQWWEKTEIDREARPFRRKGIRQCLERDDSWENELLRQYESGTSEPKLAEANGMSRQAIHKRLQKARERRRKRQKSNKDATIRLVDIANKSYLIHRNSS